MTPLRTARRVGDLRPSQLLLTFGVGAVVDLPNLSVMVMGLEDWPEDDCKEIAEERLLAAVRRQLGPQVQKLLAPPVAESTGLVPGPFDESTRIGVPVAPFPRWLLCPSCRLLAPLSSGLFELKLDPYRPDHNRYIHANCTKPGKPPTVVPARFLVACEQGHLDDFPWVEYVHRGPTGCNARLRLLEVGTSGEATDVFVKCEVCNRSLPMSGAFGEEGREHMPNCRARRPHLRDFDSRGCDEQMRTILLGASNSWFPVILSALSIPKDVDTLSQLIEEHWPVLQNAQNQQNVQLLRQIGQLRPFAKYSDADIWAAIEEKRAGKGREQEDGDLKTPEWEVYSKPDASLNGRDFQLRPVEPPADYRAFFTKIVLAERLREVRSLIGFTRIVSPGDFGDPDEAQELKRAPLCRASARWAPTSDVRGEGIFIQFSEAAVEGWSAKLRQREREFFEAHRRWRSMRGLEPAKGYPMLRYVLLHSFAHALMRQLSLECGYTTASIRERIYSRPETVEGEAMAGVLLYTAAADSEGTLGGLVSLGEPRNFGRHLDQALEGLRLCASDPLCAEHHPYRDSLTLHGAACHACLFAPETSCERGNKYLDRSVLVRTVDREDSAFFEA
jgi:hypothetical protein